MAVASIAKILTDAEKLYISVARYLGVTLRGESFEHFYSHIGSLLGIPTEDTALPSVRYLMNKELTRDLLLQLCVRLTAHREQLRTKPVPPWRGQSRDEWALAVVTGAHVAYRNKGDKGSQLKLLVVSGSAAGTMVSAWWSWRFCIAASRKLGFPRRRGDVVSPVHFRHPRDFVRLRLTIKLQGGVTDMPKFNEIRVKDSLRDFNLKLLRKRFRVTAKCPQGYADTFMCHNCPHGTEICELATHRLEFRRDACPQCNHDSTFDPEFSNRICLDCLERPSGKTTEEKPAQV